MNRLTAFLALFLLLTASSAQQKIPASTPLGRYLSADGLLRLPADVQGSLDPSGWKLRSGLRGAPAFTSSSLLSDPADTAWDARFDSVGGMDNQVYAITVSGTDVYVGGQFTTAGAATVNGIARWDGSSWHALGSGMNNMVRAIVVSGTDVYASGQFTSAGGSPAFYVAKWDGSAWSPLGSGMDGIVYALAVKGSDLYAGGLFTTAGGVSASNIAKWDGSSWSALGSGMNSYVFAFAERGTDLIAGGDFTTAGGVSANRVASWDGSNWSALGSGTDSYVLALAMSGNDVVAGGDFLTAGGVSASRIARWDGSSWSALGAGMNNYVFSLATNGTEIYAGGYFTLAGGTNANYVARYDSLGWSALGSGTSGFSVFALGAKYGSLYAGGNFTAAGGKPSLFFGRWSLPPWTITASAGSGGAVSPAGSVAVENGTDTLFAFAPSAGYHVDSIVVDGAYAGDSLSYRFTNVTGNHAISVTFAINVYAIAASAGANGAVAPTGSVAVPHGSDVFFTFAPDAGYHVDSILVDGAYAGDSLSYRFINVTGNRSIAVTFALNQYGITATAGAHGSIAPSGAVSVFHGSDAIFSFTPSAGYHVDSIVVDGLYAGDSIAYRFTNITVGHTIRVSYAINVYTISASSGLHGTVTPAGGVAVAHGADSSFLFTSSFGYRVDSIRVDGVYAGDSATYRFTHVTADHSIHVSFRLKSYAVTASAGAHGTVTPSGGLSMLHGADTSFAFTPDPGYDIDSLFIDGVYASGVSPLALLNVAGPRTVYGTFRVAAPYAKTYRTASYEDWALAVDQKGKPKSVKRKNDKVLLKFLFVAPGAASGFTLSADMLLSGGVSAGTAKLIPVGEPFAGEKSRSFDLLSIAQGDTFQFEGTGAKGKPAKATVTWMTAPKPTKLIVTAFLKNHPALPAPNLHNAGEELFGFGQSSTFPSGLLVGVPRGVKGASSVIHLSYKDVQKSLMKLVKGVPLLHQTFVACLDTFPGDLKPISKQLKNLPPDKYSNALFAELLTLKLNLAASIVSKFPNGLGELTYLDDSDSSPFNGQMVSVIAAKADSMISCLPVVSKPVPPTFNDLFDVLEKINGAFRGATLDSAGFEAKTSFTGAKRLIDVPFLRLTPGVAPRSLPDEPAVEEMPQVFHLSQNYPNPFNPTTTIRFALPSDAVVSLRVYNMLGQAVATLADREEMSSGEQEVEFDASSLSSGVYFYRISVASLDEEAPGAAMTSVMKMVVLK